MTVIETGCPKTAGTMAAGTAAQELQLKRGEFAIAVHVGLVRVLVQQGGGGRARVRKEEVDRLRAQNGFPETLREQVRTVGTAEGARLLGISPDRFTRLARAGCLTPITFYLNRYRAVVWLYLAEELAGFAAREPRLLVGKSPAWVRSRLEDGVDCRAREWRSRRIERLLSLTEEPWARVAVLADTLDPVQLAEVVEDPYERAHLARIRSEPAYGPTVSPAARETMVRLMQADEPDEMLWRRVGLILELDHAREVRQAPRPGDGWRPRPGPGHDPGPEPESVHGRGPEPHPGAGIGPAAEPGPGDRPELGGEARPGIEPDLASVPECAPDFGPGPMSEPAPAFVPERDSDRTDDQDTRPGHPPTVLPEPARGLLARLGLRRHPSRRSC
ncbi:DUF6397 family protein [Streptomyces sp. NPDC015032]|uniref:DUF6397 family protein n=1 Tax=Streptomyces sp. NPDC015032 TaxID=3364937 RepID=UPI0037011A01